MRGRGSRYLALLLLLPAAGLAFAVAAAYGVSTWMPPEDSAVSLVCGVSLALPEHDQAFEVDSTRIVVAMDEEWRTQAGVGAEEAARRMIVEAASLFRGVHIHLLVVRSVEWESPDDMSSVQALLGAAEESVLLDDVDIAVVLTAQAVSTSEDGDARIGDRFAIVARHPDQPKRDVMVLAHELSHLFWRSSRL